MSGSKNNQTFIQWDHTQTTKQLHKMEGVPQKTTTLHNNYLVKVATLGGGGQNTEKNGYVVCVWPLNKLLDKKRNS